MAALVIYSIDVLSSRMIAFPVLRKANLSELIVIQPCVACRASLLRLDAQAPSPSSPLATPVSMAVRPANCQPLAICSRSPPLIGHRGRWRGD